MVMSKSWLISRRTALKGLGVAVGLPLLEQMGWAETPKKGGEKAPVRMAFMYYDLGVWEKHWWPSQQKGAPLPSSLKPIEKLMGDVLILGGLNQLSGQGGPDGGGDHARSAGTFLTGTRLKKTNGADISNGISVDQFAAQRIGAYTKLPSIELGIKGGRGGGDCDSGYSCAYSTNISWRSSTAPMAKEISPKSAYMRLFADKNASASDQAKAAMALENKSLLDLVNEDAKAMRKELGGADTRKMDEYLDSMRSLESRLQSISGRDNDDAAGGDPKKKSEALILPTGVPKRWDEHAELMMDIMTLAFQTDTTRIATFMMTNGAGGVGWEEIGISEGHHDLSHHGGNEGKLEKMRLINIHMLKSFAKMLEKMKKIQDGKGTLLDNCMLMHGSGLGDGDRHSHTGLPIILAGRGGGSINTGRFVASCKGNMCDLYLAMLARMGVQAPTFGDGTKILPDLS
jgi:Protein of unknown function (DUF1552)